MTFHASEQFTKLLNIKWPIIQAPMAGVSTPAMAAAVSHAGGLGSISLGATSVAEARARIAAVRALSHQPFNINLFCHQPAIENPTLEAAWLDRLRPEFHRVEAEPPTALREIYKSFLEDKEMFSTVLEAKPKIVSFHFGLPSPQWIREMRETDIILLASTTNIREARLAAAAGVHAVIAQGYEAGGHRGIFDPDREDDQLGTVALTRILVRKLDLPIIAAGGIMDGSGIAAALQLGASAAMLGTAFIATPESTADEAYRKALLSESAYHTVMTRAISGRPARCLPNRFTQLGKNIEFCRIPKYPIAYDAGKSLHTAAKAVGDFSYGAQWAGQGAPLVRALPTERLMTKLISEFLEK